MCLLVAGTTSSRSGLKKRASLLMAYFCHVMVMIPHAKYKVSTNRITLEYHHSYFSPFLSFWFNHHHHACNICVEHQRMGKKFRTNKLTIPPTDNRGLGSQKISHQKGALDYGNGYTLHACLHCV